MPKGTYTAASNSSEPPQPSPWPNGENPTIRDAYDQMLAQDPRCEHGKKPGKCIPCNSAGGAR